MPGRFLSKERFSILVDSNEHAVGNTWTFPNNRVIVRPLVRYGCDYAVHGQLGLIGVERKSFGDYVVCCGREWERFQRQLDKLQRIDHHALIVEGNIDNRIYYGSKMNTGAVVHKTALIVARGIPVVFAANKNHARNLCLKFFRESLRLIRER